MTREEPNQPLKISTKLVERVRNKRKNISKTKFGYGIKGLLNFSCCTKCSY